MSIDFMCRIVRLGCSLSRVIEGPSQEESDRLVGRINFVSRPFIFGIEASVLAHQIAGSSPDRVRDLKGMEFAARFVAFVTTSYSFCKKPTAVALENGLGLLIGSVRALSESRQEISLFSKPSSDGECDRFDGFDGEGELLEESEWVTNFTSDASQGNNVEPSPETAVVSSGLSVLETTLATKLVSRSTTWRITSLCKEEDESNFLKLDVIPPQLHNDPILSRYMCTITKAPIRHIVSDPNRKAFYERAAIVQWINAHHTSPVTRRHLEEKDLIPLPATQSLIDTRLLQLAKLYGRSMQQ